MGNNYKRCTIVFNLNNPMHKDLYDWCVKESSNFSDFARSILFMYKNSQSLGRNGGVISKSVEIPKTDKKEDINFDASKMSDLL